MREIACAHLEKLQEDRNKKSATHEKVCLRARPEQEIQLEPYFKFSVIGPVLL